MRKLQGTHFRCTEFYGVAHTIRYTVYGVTYTVVQG